MTNLTTHESISPSGDAGARMFSRKKRVIRPEASPPWTEIDDSDDNANHDFLRVIAWIVLAFIGAMLIGSVIILSSHAHAHMHDRPEMNDWLSSLHNHRKGLCCQFDEATTVTDPDWARIKEIKEGCADGEKPNRPGEPEEHVTYCVRIDHVWWKVYDGSLIDEPNRAGPALVWISIYNDASGKHQFIRCFLRGAEG